MAASEATVRCVVTSEVDYAEAGRNLLAQVNLENNDKVGKVERYSNYNAIWGHPTSGAILYVGNATTAANRAELSKIDVTRIVFCQESDGTCHFESDNNFRYLKFPIGSWKRNLGYDCGHDRVWEFFKQLFDFLDEELGRGNNILIHCLAGAHRAGTAGVASLMYLCNLDRTEAIPLAKSLRQAIDPIGSFPELLKLLDDAFEAYGRGSSNQNRGQDQIVTQHM